MHIMNIALFCINVCTYTNIATPAAMYTLYIVYMHIMHVCILHFFSIGKVQYAYIHTCTCMYTCMYVCMHVHVCMYACIHICIHVHVCIHVWSIHVCMYANCTFSFSKCMCGCSKRGSRAFKLARSVKKVDLQMILDHKVRRRRRNFDIVTLYQILQYEVI